MADVTKLRPASGEPLDIQSEALRVLEAITAKVAIAPAFQEALWAAEVATAPAFQEALRALEGVSAKLAAAAFQGAGQIPGLASQVARALGDWKPPASWTEPAAAKGEIAARLALIATGQPCAPAWEAMREALTDPADDVERDALDALDAGERQAELLVRKWAEHLATFAPLLLAALFRDDDPPPDYDAPRVWVERFADWLARQEHAAADREADELRALLAQGEIPGTWRLLWTVRWSELVLARLTWAGTVRDWWEGEIERRKVAGMALPTAQTLLALRTRGSARPYQDRGRDLVEVSGDPQHEVTLDLVGLPVGLAERFMRGDLRDLRSRAFVGVLDVVLRTLAAEQDLEPFDGRRPPKLSIRAGRGLAEAAGLGTSGAAGRAADDAVWTLTGIRQGDWTGTMRRFLLGPERVAHAPGRPAAWIVTPGELLLPSLLAAEASQAARTRHLPRGARGWRRFVPWPDLRAPDEWAPAGHALGEAPWVALSLLVDWTEAAGLEHGRRWLEQPGVCAGSDAGWRALVERAGAPGVETLRAAALDAWGDAGWIELKGDLIAPGPALPRLRESLRKLADKARRNARKRRS